MTLLTQCRDLCEAAEMTDEECVKLYYPCDCGIHICGHMDISGGGCIPITIANFPFTDCEKLEAVFQVLRLEFEAPNGEDDCAVDMFDRRDNMPDNFGISRQMVDRCIRTLASLTQEQGNG